MDTLPPDLDRYRRPLAEPQRPDLASIALAAAVALADHHMTCMNEGHAKRCEPSRAVYTLADSTGKEIA